MYSHVFADERTPNVPVMSNLISHIFPHTFSRILSYVFWTVHPLCFYMTQNYFAIRGFCVLHSVLLVTGMAKAARSNAPSKTRIVVCANDMQLDCNCLNFVNSSN